MELLACTQSLKLRAPQIDEENLIMAMGQLNCLCCEKPTEKDLMCYLATGFPAVYLLFILFSTSSSLACSLGFVRTPAAYSACCMQLSRCIVMGFAGLKLACNVCTPSHSPTLA